MADTDFTDTTTTTPGTTIVAAWLDDVNRHVYWGRNIIFATTAGTANAQTLTLPATSLYSAYSGGDRFPFKAGAGLTNTTTCTLQVIGASTLAAKTIKNLDGSNLVAGQITAARVYEVVYEATADCFYLLGGIAILNDLAVDTLSATGVITSTLATGTAPFTVASTTKVSNLNVDQLDGADWAAPAAIGSGTPAAGTFTTIVASGTITPQAGVVGTTTNDSASAGNVGEILTASLASGSATALVTATPKTIISVSLTAGDWDVSGVIGFIAAATTNITMLSAGISATDNTLGADGTYANHYNASAGEVPGAVTQRIVTPITRVSLASTTTYYLIASQGFTVDTLTGFGNIRARRVR